MPRGHLGGAGRGPGHDHLNPVTFSDGLHVALVIAGFTLMGGGLLAWATIRRPLHTDPEAGVPVPTSHCARDAPPMRADCSDIPT